MTAIAIQRRDEIVQRMAQGELLANIAHDLGVSAQALSKVLTLDPGYRDAVAAGMHLRLDHAEMAIEQAAEQVDVARARARFQSVAWRAEREFPERWGQRTELHVIGDGLGQILEGICQRKRNEQIEDIALLPADPSESPKE